MKILIISNYYPPEIGAASNRIYCMAESLHKKNHLVTIISPLPNYPKGKIFKEYSNKFFIKESLSGINNYRFWIYATISKSPIARAISMISFSLTLWLSIFKIKNLKKYDKVIIQNSPLFVSFSSIILFKKIYNLETILNVSDLWPKTAQDLGQLKKGILLHILEMIEKFNYSNSDKIIGQSKEILKHISSFINRPSFHYRNLQKNNSKFFSKQKIKKKEKFTLIYAGLLGVAQGIYELIKNIDLSELDIELHIYGEGNEKSIIESYCTKNPKNNIKYCGILTKKDILKILPSYHLSIVPLKHNIIGAFPSKIYELTSCNVPIIYLGKGEAKDFIIKNKLGFCLNPSDYKGLNKLISEIVLIDKIDYISMTENCTKTTLNYLDFDKQIEELNNFLIK
tara:strand:- start:5469 stop:6659 length:1191 start_codon:yes stop_codon:yes gene_type:complete